MVFKPLAFRHYLYVQIADHHVALTYMILGNHMLLNNLDGRNTTNLLYQETYVFVDSTKFVWKIHNMPYLTAKQTLKSIE